MKSWRVLEPKKMNKIMKSLDPLNTEKTTLSPVCPSYRRMFCLPCNNCSSETPSLITSSSFEGSLSESYNPKNLEQSSTISKSCPNMVIFGSYSDGSDETDNVNKSSNCGRISPTFNNSSNKNTDHIKKGTVRSLINHYGSANHVFDTRY